MKRFLNRLFSPIVVAWGRTPVVWIWRQPRTNLEFIRQIESRYYNPGSYGGKQLILARLLYFPMLLMWPFRAVLICISQYRKHAAEICNRFHVPRTRQLISLFRIGIQYWTSPQVYYLFELFRDRDVRQANTYLLENSMTALLGVINNGKSDSHIQDKHEFNHTMGEKGFPVINDLGLVKSGRICDVNGAILQLPEYDFIAKPVLGLEGRGLARYDWSGNGQYRSAGGEQFTRDQLERHLLRLSQQEVLLLQPRMTNHHSIQELATGQFCTCRIITGITTSSAVEVIVAVFKMPTGKNVADNFGAGGLASGIDLDTGALGRAVYKYKSFEEFTEHPDTGAIIVGKRLPYWQETLDLVRSAHKQVDGKFAFLGWDVGITEEGPVIVETQVTFGFILCERPGRVAMGATRFPDIYRQWIDGKNPGSL